MGGTTKIMFGKNYDKEISDIIQVIKGVNDNMKNLNYNVESIQKVVDSLQDNMITIAKVQAQHKAIVSFLVNHASVDEDAKEDLEKMMREIIKVERDVNKELKKNKEAK